MKVIDEKQRLRKELMELRIQQTLRNHLADVNPEEYERIVRQIKVIKRRMATIAYEEKKKKGR